MKAIKKKKKNKNKKNKAIGILKMISKHNLEMPKESNILIEEKE